VARWARLSAKAKTSKTGSAAAGGENLQGKAEGMTGEAQEKGQDVQEKTEDLRDKLP
jgi:hypothetical protein